MTFKELVEKATLNTDAGWMILRLDSGAEIQINVNLLSKGEVKIAAEDDRKPKTLKIPARSDVQKVLESYLEEKLDRKDPNVVKFLKMFGDCQ